MQVIDLADAVDEPRDVVAEQRLDLAERARRVFDDIVQQRGLDGAGVEMQAGENLRDGYGMCDVGIAVAAFLALVRLRGELVGLRDAREVGGGQVRLELRDESAKVIG